MPIPGLRGNHFVALCHNRSARVGAGGIVIAVGWQDGTLLLETPEGFPLLVLDVAVNIRDPLGIIRVL